MALFGTPPAKIGTYSQWMGPSAATYHFCARARAPGPDFFIKIGKNGQNREIWVCLGNVGRPRKVTIFDDFWTTFWTTFGTENSLF